MSTDIDFLIDDLDDFDIDFIEEIDDIEAASYEPVSTRNDKKVVQKSLNDSISVQKKSPKYDYSMYSGSGYSDRANRSYLRDKERGLVQTKVYRNSWGFTNEEVENILGGIILGLFLIVEVGALSIYMVWYNLK